MHLMIKNGTLWKFEVLDTSGPGPKTQNWFPKAPMGPAMAKIVFNHLKNQFLEG